MPYNHQLPVFVLSNPEKLWLEEVYTRNENGVRFSFEHIRVALEGRIPMDFTYQHINTSLLEHNGTSITLLGILAIEPSSDIVERVNNTAMVIRQLILKDVDIQDISVAEISEITGFTINNTSFYLHLLSLTGRFHSGSSMESNTTLLKSIRIGGNEVIFNNYMSFSGVETLIVNRLRSSGPQPGPTFSHQEIYVVNEKLDNIIEQIEQNFIGTALELIEIRNDINEMRQLFQIPKKNWFQTLVGKLTGMTISGVVSETLSKEVIRFFSGFINRIGF